MWWEAVRHARQVLGDIRTLQALPEEEVMAFAKNIGAPLSFVWSAPNRAHACSKFCCRRYCHRRMPR
jgi:pyridoxal biosynthesis lyase PdxS